MGTFFKRLKTIITLGAKPEDHLNWSTQNPDFLEDLQEQPIRQMVFQQIKDDFEENKFVFFYS